MEEIIVQPPVTPAAAPAAKQQSWGQFLESEAAVRVIYLVFGLLAIAMVMTFLQTRTDAICCGDWDGYYHIKWSSLLWENFRHGKWLPSFDWLPLTVLNPNDYADHHFLFHLLQIPFLWFFEPVTAAKVSTIFYSTLAIFSIYWMIYRYEIKHQLIWLAAILTCANAFYYRMNMGKAPPLTIIISVLGIHLLFQRKYVWLLPLMFAFVWTYSLFPLLLIAALIWTVIIAWNERRFEWRPLAYTFAGMVLGNLINPYFPHNLNLFLEHFLEKFKVGSDFVVAVGGEWYPYSGMELLTNFPVAMLAMVIGYILFVPRGSKIPEKAAFFLAFVTILLAAQFRSKRFAEYFPPFAVLFAAFSLQAFTMPAITGLPEDFNRELEPYFDVDKLNAADVKWKIVRQAGVWTIGLALCALWVVNMVGLNKLGFDYGGLMNDIKTNESNDRYRRAMQWATGLDATGAENIPKGDRIYNTNWDKFPKLFFFDTKHSYVYGLDPNYLYSADPEKFKLLGDINDGKVDDPGPLIRDKFGSNWVFTDSKDNTDLVAKLLDSGWGEMAYEDDEARIIKIRANKGEPFDAAKDDSPETPEEKKILDDEEHKAGANRDLDDEDNDNQ
jgi:hypothetical protein